MGYTVGIDVGNTQAVIGVFPEDDSLDILCHWRIHTQPERSPNELEVLLDSFFRMSNLDPKQVGGLIYSSVVPSFNESLEIATRNFFPIQESIQVRWDMGLPLIFEYPRPEEIGADRLVNACAATEIYKGDLIIVDMGTATTFCVIHKENRYLGGSIAPGLNLSMASLGKRAAQLHSIDFQKPLSGAIGRSTREAMQAGFFFGWAGILREILGLIRKTNPERKYKAIASGGLASTFGKELPELFDHLNPLLTLYGLKQIYRKLKKRK